MHALEIVAGQRAYQRIREQGFKVQDVRMVLGASGGPKWFVLSHLDRLLNREVLSQCAHPVHLAGSSIGAWRMACYASKDPASALKRLETEYLNQAFAPGASVDDITRQCTAMLDAVLGSDYQANPGRPLHIITARCKGFTRREESWRQALAFAAVAGSNVFSRRTLKWYFDRHLVQTLPGSLPVHEFNDFRTTMSQLDQHNLRPALMASAAIPMALRGVTDLPGSSPGLYRDGGMVDYHFDLPFDTEGGYVLYPHFSPTVKPGWFDKPLRWRHVQAQHYQDVVMLRPSAAFVAKLPHGKIPDRTDFKKMSDSERKGYWQRAVQAGERLAEEMHDWHAAGGPGASVKLFDPKQ